MVQLLQKYPNDVRFIYRHFPLDSIHDKAKLGTQAAEAAGCADEQGKFWEMHDRLFANQKTLKSTMMNFLKIHQSIYGLTPWHVCQ